jgi:hypothetical protein
MPLKPLVRYGMVVVFVSSSSETQAQYLRTRLKELASEINDQLHAKEKLLQLRVEMWEMVPPGRSRHSRLNERFIKMALRSHCTVALLVRELRPGTRDEIRAVLGVDDVDLAVLFFPPHGRRDRVTMRLRFFLWRNRNRFLYRNCGDPYSSAADDGIRQTLWSAALDYLKVGEPLFETRGP